jgi:hypothetical protein
MARGKPPPRGTRFGAEYFNTTLVSKHGDRGSQVAAEEPHRRGVAGGYGRRGLVGDRCEPRQRLPVLALPRRGRAAPATEAWHGRWPSAAARPCAGAGRAGKALNITGRFVTNSAPRGELVGDIHAGIAVVRPYA